MEDNETQALRDVFKEERRGAFTQKAEELSPEDLLIFLIEELHR